MGKWASKQRRYSETDEPKHSKMTRRRKRSSTRSEREMQTESKSTRPDKIMADACKKDAVSSIEVISPNLCISACKDGCLVMQDLNKGTLLHKWNAHKQSVTKVKCKSSLIASASRDLTIGLWNMNNPESCKGKLSGHSLVVSAIDLNSEGSMICSGSRDNTVRVWDVETQQCLMENNISRNLVTDLKWADAQNLVVQTSEDKTIKLWDTRLLEVVHTFPTLTQIQTCCDLRENTFLTGNNGFSGQGCQINLWDLRQRQVLMEYCGHTESVSGCSFFGPSDSCKRFVSSCNDGTLAFWQDTKPNYLSAIDFGIGTLTCVTSLNENTVLCGSLTDGIGIARIDSKENLFII